MSASTKRRLPLYLTLAGLLIFILALLFKTWRLYNIATSLQNRQLQGEQLLAQGPMNIDANEAEALVVGLRNDIVDLKTEVAPFLPLATRLGWLPEVGGLLENAPALLEMADAGTAAALFGFRALKPALEIIQADNPASGSPLPDLLSVVAAGQADLVQAQLAIDRVAAARADIPTTDEFPWRVQQLFGQFDENLPLAQDGLVALQLLPELMGFNGRRTYLILAQNEDELRPSGGFISGAGTLTVENGDIVDLSFEDANLIDDFANKEYGPAPEPMLNIMGIYYLLFRDSNWYGDFPTTAETAMELYTYGQNTDLDGVIALDKRFVELFLEATGPIYVPELETTFTSENVVTAMRAAWGITEGQDVVEWVISRKSFMGPLAIAVRNHVEQNPTAIDPFQLAMALEAAIAGKHLQLYFRDPPSQAVLEQLNWDAAIENRWGQDSLFLVEANLGYSKVNPAISRQLNYTVFLDELGGGTARASIRLQHASPETDSGCQHVKSYDEGLSYDDLLDDCYWVYFQLYTPAGSTLIQSSQHPVAANQIVSELAWPGQASAMTDEISGLALFANFLLLQRAQVQEPFFLYTLPQGVSRQNEAGQWSYSLLVQKQAGVSSLPISIQLILPEGSVPYQLPAGAIQDGNIITLQKSVTQDELFIFLYQ